MFKSFWHPWSRLFVCAVAATGVFFNATASASTWTVRNPSLIGPQLNGVAFGSGRSVAVGLYGTIVTSTDLLSWTPQNHGSGRHFQDVIFADGKFVAVGGLSDNSGYHSLVATSPDGLNWTEHPVDSGPFTSIAYANGVLVAVGHYNIYTSSDGVIWTPRTPAHHVLFSDIAHGNNTFVAIGTWRDDRDNRGVLEFYSVQRSSDGATWVGEPAPTSTPMHGIAFGNGQFVMVGQGGAIFTSPDGRQWARQHVHGGFTLNDVVFVDGSFIAVGNHGNILRSTDGTNWLYSEQSAPRDLFACAAALDRFVAVGKESCVLTSQDKSTWSSPTSVTYSDLRGITAGGSKFVAVGMEGNGVIADDGRNWSASRVFPSSSTWFNAVAFGNDVFAAVGGLGAPFYRSSDGSSWTGYHSNLGIDNHLDVAYGGGRFVSVGLLSNGGYGARGGIRVSANGIDWTGVTSASTNGLRCVTYGNGRWVAAGDNRLITSLDSSNWAEHASPPVGTLKAATFGKDRFVLAGDVGGVVTSTDGTSWSHKLAFQWSQGSASGTDEILGLTFGDNEFIAVGKRPTTGEGVIWSSPDGLTWTQVANAPRALNSVAYNGSSLAAVGDGGLIMQSGSEATANGVARLTIRRASSDSVELSCNTQPGVHCRLQFSEDGRSWNDLTSFQSTGSATYRDSLVQGKIRLYRLVSP